LNKNKKIAKEFLEKDLKKTGFFSDSSATWRQKSIFYGMKFYPNNLILFAKGILLESFISN
jgi:hypothetical protein